MRAAYHVMPHAIFQRAVRDQLILTNPCEHMELPKVVLRRSRTLTPAEFDQIDPGDPRVASADGRDRYRNRV
jgi:hypothetical protein